jgi:hypothetical protein
VVNFTPGWSLSAGQAVSLLGALRLRRTDYGSKYENIKEKEDFL